ncbi:hypothetical protein GQ43DRAFT_395835 [Delitschia confertaspora ATCC 74209]|uniref:Ribosomal protein L9 domain-containing protein n=1 Tax=Delitschia confertaspora ATCC 74209 TaxID=1513339 RepID=A0A9P4JJV3_9PLEO|nr:hypothetical protein GQ43DRAFT_395835 [Delitschia confertaspora ATCC 74209]
MAPLMRSALLPQCTSCLRRYTQIGLEAWRPLEQQRVRNISKAARKAEDSIVVKLIQDVRKFGRKGSYVPVTPALMRNKWLPMRLANYVPQAEVKQLKAQGTIIQRDFEFGVKRPLVEVETQEEDVEPTHYVRPVEIEFLSPERSMELLTTFVPPTIDFLRQPKEQDNTERMGASSAADVLSAAASRSNTGIYGSVSTGDVASTIRQALAHNDEAARVILLDKDIKFLEGTTEGDSSRIKQLGKFKVEIKVSGATEPLVRTVRIRAKSEES